MLHLDVRDIRLVEFKVKPAEHRRDGGIELGKGEAVVSCLVSRLETQSTSDGIILDAQAHPPALPERDKITVQRRVFDPALRNEFRRVREDLLVRQHVDTGLGHGRIPRNGPGSIGQFGVGRNSGVAGGDPMSESDAFAHAAVEVRELLELVPVGIRGCQVGCSELLTKFLCHIGVVYDVETRDAQSPRGGDEAGRDDKLCLVS